MRSSRKGEKTPTRRGSSSSEVVILSAEGIFIAGSMFEEFDPILPPSVTFELGLVKAVALCGYISTVWFGLLVLNETYSSSASHICDPRLYNVVFGT